MTMKIYKIILVSFLALSLNACETFEGVKRDFGLLNTAVGSKVQDIKTVASDNTKEVPQTATVILNDGTCPPISVDPQLNSVSEFYDIEKPSSGTEVSTLNLIDTKSACEVNGEFLEVQIEISFAGELGPKAKRKTGDRPFFAYPYFIAVTDNEGTELAKELFAASVTYDSKQEKIQLVDTIRQKLPLNDDGSTPAYQIKIGFQLTEKQLFYNASR